MSSTATLIDRNRLFASDFTAAELPVLPKLRTVVHTCGDARADPAHVLGLGLGDTVVIRNNGGRVTPEVAREIAALAFIVARMDGAKPGPYELVIMQPTHCGDERFADADLQRAIKKQAGTCRRWQFPIMNRACARTSDACATRRKCPDTSSSPD
jgi:carbonic anhydrase